jgi:assimilatory nitrate reductase catalytic subunit
LPSASDNFVLIRSVHPVFRAPLNQQAKSLKRQSDEMFAAALFAALVWRLPSGQAGKARRALLVCVCQPRETRSQNEHQADEQTMNTLPIHNQEPVATHCPYCALQCGMIVHGRSSFPAISPNEFFSLNRGALCIKGWTSAEVLNHPERLLRPLARNAAGRLSLVSWEEAFERIISAISATQAKYGRDAVAMLSGGSLTNEKAYLMGKFARLALGTRNIDYNGRFCMSSAAAASLKAFGVDRGLPFPVEDIPLAAVVLLVGSNPAETMPPLMQYFEKQRLNGGRLIVIDPRFSDTAAKASLHLKVTPGADAALANGILHLLVRDSAIDENYIGARTEGFEKVRAEVVTYWPDRVERITGVPEAQLARVARLLAAADTAMIISGRGSEQQAQGVTNTLAWINLALALGLPGKPYSGFGTLTGQGNGQGGREHGQKADQLPGYRRIDDPAARRHVAAVWGVDESEIPGPGHSAYELMNAFGSEIRTLLTFAFNFTVSAPDVSAVKEKIKKLDFLCVSDFFLSETAKLADVVLPSAQWAEEEGTMTNLEGRVIRRRRALLPPLEARSDLDVLCELAHRLGCGRFFSYANTEEVFNELARASTGGVADYSGITYDKIDELQGVHWPCPSAGHPGTPHLFRHSFQTPNGKAKFHAVRHLPAAEEPDADYPYFLTTGRALVHYQSGTQTRRVEKLQEMAPEAYAEIHPQTARRHGLTDNSAVTLRTRRGAAIFRVKLSSGIREDTIFAPFHWGGEHSANALTNAALDPVSRMPEFKVCAVRIEKL